MRQQESKLVENHVDVKVITFDNQGMAEAYVKESNLTWPLLLDSNQEVYQAYGMARGSWWDLYGPLSILRYLKLMMGGRRPGKPGRDWNQLGGNVVIDPAGIVRLQHISTNPHDRPTIESMMELIAKGP